MRKLELVALVSAMVLAGCSSESSSQETTTATETTTAQETTTVEETEGKTTEEETTVKETAEETTVEDTTEEDVTEEETDEETEEATDDETEEETDEGNDDETTEADETKEAASLSDDLLSFQVSIDGTVISFPCTYAEFMKTTGYEYTGDEDEMIPSNRYMVSDYFNIDENNKVMAFIINFDVNEKAVADCYVGGLNIDTYGIKDAEVVLPGGVTFDKDTQESVLEKYGTPSDSYDGETYPTAQYSASTGYYSFVEFTFDAKNGGTIHEIEIENLVVPEDFVPDEIDTESVPEIVKAYVAPEELGDDLYVYAVELDGVLYQLPCPVSEFLANGWEIAEDASEETVDGSGSAKVTLTKDNQEFYNYALNYSKSATGIQNAFITDVKGDDYKCKVDIKIAKGIEIGMSEDDLKAALEGEDFEAKESSLYNSYNVKDPDSYSAGYEIIVKSGKITSITAENPVNRKDYNAAMGVEY